MNVLLVFSLISICFSGLALFGDELQGMIGGVGGFFSWIASGLWFMWIYVDTEYVHFWYFFLMLAFGSLIMFIRHVLNFSFRTPKKRKWDKYE